MGAGGVVQQRASVLLMTVTDPCFYACLSPRDKATVDALDAKSPLTRTQEDVNTLYRILGDVKDC